MTRKVCVAFAIAAWLVGGPARAQEPSVAPQRLQPFGSIPPPAPAGSSSSPLLKLFGEPTGDVSVLPGYFASAPLRLGLQSQVFPIAGGYSECASREDASGNSVGGIPIQRYTLLRLTPNLALHGFTSGGCPIDGAIGAGITYSVPIRPTLWLVAGAGIYTAPAPALNAAARTQGDFRLDLVKQVGDQRSFSIGIGKRGVSFGGVF